MPLSYAPFTAVLEHLSFLKRKQLVLLCPSIRKPEQNYPYHLDVVKIDGHFLTIRIDSFWAQFGKSKDGTATCHMSLKAYKRVAVPIPNCSETEALEKFALFHLSRAGTTVKKMMFENSGCLLKCAPLTIKNLVICNLPSVPERSASWVPTMRPVEQLTTDGFIRDDTISNARNIFVCDSFLLTLEESSVDLPPIVSEWNCYQLEVALGFKPQGIVDYCKEVVKRSRPIGSSFISIIKHRNVECTTLDWIAARAGVRKTWWNERKCATIPIDETTELNLYGDLEMFSEKLIIEVNAKGTAKDR